MQNYKNHIKFYKPYHFMLIPFSVILLGLSIYRFVHSLAVNNGNAWLWGILTAAILLIIWLAVMTRQHYALFLQNRIIIDEVRFRYYKMTGKTLEEEYNLKDKQYFALRFAGDDEFLDLLQKADEENLSSKEIKQAITNWKPDYRRV